MTPMLTVVVEDRCSSARPPRRSVGSGGRARQRPAAAHRGPIRGAGTSGYLTAFEGIYPQSAIYLPAVCCLASRITSNARRSKSASDPSPPTSRISEALLARSDSDRVRAAIMVLSVLAPFHTTGTF